MLFEGLKLSLTSSLLQVGFDHLATMLHVVLTALLAELFVLFHLNVKSLFDLLIDLQDFRFFLYNSLRCLNVPKRVRVLYKCCLFFALFLELTLLDLLAPELTVLPLGLLLHSLLSFFLLVVGADLLVELFPLFDQTLYLHVKSLFDLIFLYSLL